MKILPITPNGANRWFMGQEVTDPRLRLLLLIGMVIAFVVTLIKTKKFGRSIIAFLIPEISFFYVAWVLLAAAFEASKNTYSFWGRAWKAGKESWEVWQASRRERSRQKKIRRAEGLTRKAEELRKEAS